MLPYQQRPARILIEVINEIPEEALKEVSPESLGTKKYIKVPMLLLLINAGLQSGLSIVFCKFIGELIASGDAINHLSMMLLIVICIGLSTMSTVHSLNLAMMNFD